MGDSATRRRRSAHRDEGRQRRRPLRDLGVACWSAGVLAFLVAYALAAPSAELRASVGPTIPRPGSDAVVEGRILAADGSGVQGARIEVRRAGHTAASGVSRDGGEFRLELDGGCAAYDISLRARANGALVESVAQRRLCPGDTLPVLARVITQGHFLWVPGPR